MIIAFQDTLGPERCEGFQQSPRSLKAGLFSIHAAQHVPCAPPRRAWGQRRGGVASSRRGRPLPGHRRARRGARASPITPRPTPRRATAPTDDDRTPFRDDPDAVFGQAPRRHHHPQPGDPVLLGLPRLRRRAKPPPQRAVAGRGDNRLDKDLSKGGGPSPTPPPTSRHVEPASCASAARRLAQRRPAPPRPQGPRAHVLRAGRPAPAALVRMIRNYDPRTPSTSSPTARAASSRCWPRPS